MKKKFQNQTFKNYKVFSILYFCAFFLLIEFILFKLGKSYIWSIDGMSQQYTSFAYGGKIIREACKNLLSHGTFTLPQWDMSIGYGSDIPTFLAGIRFDPFFWLFVFVPVRFTELAFAGMICFKMYFAGISFMAFCLKRKHNAYCTIMGSMMYAFSGTILIGLKQESFLNVFYIFPLIMIGVDRLWKEKKWGVYVFALTWSIINSYYFTYMIAIMIVFHACIRFMLHEDHRVKNFFELFTRFLKYSILSGLIGVGLILPDLKAITSQDRVSIKRTIPLMYESVFSDNTFAGIISTYDMWTDCIIGFSSIGLVLLLLLYCKKGNIGLKIELTLLTICIFIPYIGHVLNGFNYSTNRWVFVLSFVAAYGTVISLEGIKEFRIRDFVMVASVLAIYGIYVRFRLKYVRNDFWIPFCLACAFIILLPLITRSRTEKLEKIAVTSAVIVSVGLTSFYYLDSKGDGFASTEQDRDTAYESVTGDVKASVYGINDIKNSRYDSTIPRCVRNSNMLLGLNGYDFYNSIYNNSIDQYHNNLALITPYYSFGYSDLDQRSLLEYMNGTRYFVGRDENGVDCPFGFSDKVKKYNDSIVWESDQKNSLVMYYEKTLSEKEYLTLSPEERERALSQVAIVADKGSASIKDLQLPDNSISYTVAKMVDVDVKDNKYHVTAANGYIELDLGKTVSDSEIFVYLNNLQNVGNQYRAYGISVLGCQEEKVITNTRFEAATETNHMYGGKHNWMVNAVVKENGINKIRIIFENPGEYSIDSLNLYSRNESEIKQLISQMVFPAETFDITSNKVTSKVNQEKDGYIYFSIPYSEGWMAYVDGERTKIIKANDAFMMVKTKAGTHKIELRYRSPLLAEGIILSLSMFLITLTISQIKKKKNR